LDDKVVSVYGSFILEYDYDGDLLGKIDLKKKHNSSDIVLLEIDLFDNIWAFSDNGGIYVMDDEYNLRRNFDYLGVDKIESCIGHDSSESIDFFCSYMDESGLGILHFLYSDNGMPTYIDYYQISESAGYIDMELVNNYIYLATTDGMYEADIDSNLKFMSSWNVYLQEEYILGLEKTNDILIAIQTDDYIDIVDKTGDTIHSIDEDYNHFLDFKIADSNLYLLFEDKLLSYEINQSGSISFILLSSENLENSSYNLLSINGDNVLTSINNQGFIINTDKHVITNTPSIIGYNAITLLEDGSIAAVGTILNEDESVYSAGLLHYKNQMFINYIPKTRIDDGMYKVDSEDDFYVISINYRLGEKYSRSIVEVKKNHIAFSNSGVPYAPPVDSEPSINGGVIIVDLTSGLIENIFNSDNTQTLGGLNGINNSTEYGNYIVVNEILSADGKLYILNPHNELYGNTLSIYNISNNSWEGVNVETNNLYLPQGLAIDQNNQIWIGFENSETDNSIPLPYSDGGIRFVDENNQFIEVDNDEILVGGEESSIWSVDICDYNDFEILWVLGAEGVQGYTIFQNQFSAISSMNLFSEIPFYEGDRIKCDYNSNVWITTTHSGVRTILANNNYTEYWPSYEGMTSKNSGLLSDVVYDIDFNSSSGEVYLATDKGISILRSPFSDVVYNSRNKHEVYFNVNPFITSKHENVLISNIPIGSTVLIMDLDGRVLRRIKEDDFTQYIWDGKDSNGRYLNSGIYIVASKNENNQNTISKIAIIRDN